jgi:acyl carrier protein
MMIKEEIIKNVNSIMAAKAHISPDAINPEDFYDELGADSMQCIEALVELQDEFDIEITGYDTLKVATMQDVYDLIERKVNEQ